MIKGVIFDLDGVLVSTDELHYKAWKRLAEELGIDNFTREDNEKQRGVSRMESLEVVLNKSDKEYSQEEKVALADRKNGYYVEMLQKLDSSALLAGAVETLKMLREKGYKIAVGSASKNAPLIIEKTGLLPLIDEISCGLDITKSKPDPEVFLVAAKKLNLEPKECLVVEDAAAGVEAAKAGGMKSLGVGPYYKSLGADYASETLLDVNWETVLK
ncbi:MAG: beta-phosphoglucomutase [Clostridiaceae bacterium]|nr:beta-phosphoglucomutase [Clostridiaceae bacterium]